jgi:hypothetical protein
MDTLGEFFQHNLSRRSVTADWHFGHFQPANGAKIP